MPRSLKHSDGEWDPELTTIPLQGFASSSSLRSIAARGTRMRRLILTLAIVAGHRLVSGLDDGGFARTLTLHLADLQDLVAVVVDDLHGDLAG